MGRGSLVDCPGVDVCLYLICRLLYKMPSHMQLLPEFIKTKYKQWITQTNKKKLVSLS